MKTVLHVLGDKTWKPEYRFLGSTKDIVGRRDYFAARGIRCVELQVKGRHDSNCLAALKDMDLSDVDAVLMEHPRYPQSMRYLKETFPHIRRMIRGHNSELIHQLHTAYAYLNSGLSAFRWRWKRARMSFDNAIDRARYDIACARLSDYVLAISDWEARHYWPRIVPSDRVLIAPYFVPAEYAVEPRAEADKLKRVICTMSADWSPLAHDAAKVLARVVKQSPTPPIKGWRFFITGDLGKHRDNYKRFAADKRIVVTGNVPNPFERMAEARALAHLSNLGMGFKTKLLDFVSCGGWVLMPRKLYGRQPEELKPFCIIVDPVTTIRLSAANRL